MIASLRSVLHITKGALQIKELPLPHKMLLEETS